MMRILAVYIQNFGSFAGRHFVPLANRGLVSVLGENLDDPRSRSNGAGKSTLFDAVDWCLFGETSKGDVADAVVNDIGRRTCHVTVQVKDDAGPLIQVSRTRGSTKSPNGIKVLVDGVDKSALDTAQTQETVNRLLGLNRELFHAAVYFGQGDTWKFADGTDKERKQLLTLLLPELEEVDRMALRVQELAGQADAKLLEATSRLQYTESARAQLGPDPSPRVQQWEDGRAARAGMAQAQAADAQRSLDSNRAALAALPEEPPPPEISGGAQSPELTAAAAELATARANHHRLTSHLRDLSQRQGAAEAKCEMLRAPKASACPVCKRPMEQGDVAAAAEALRQAEQARSQVLAEIADVKNQIAQSEAHGLQVSSRWNELSAADQQWKAQQAAAVGGWRQRKAERSRLVEQCAFSQTMLQRALQQLKQVQEELNPVLGELAAYRQRAAALEVDLAAAQAAVEAARQRQARIAFWKTGLGPKGIKSFLLDAHVQTMAAEANRWVHLLTAGTVGVTFSTQREVGKGSSKKLVEDFSIRVFKSNPDGTVVERNYRSWSGGEKYRIALGIDFGLARLVAQRARQAYDLLILDELFQKSLDASGKEAVVELLQALAQEKSSIFVIDHDAQFQHMFHDRLVVRKKNRRSFVVGGIHHGEPSAAQGPGQEPSSGGGVLATHPAFPEGDF